MALFYHHGGGRLYHGGDSVLAGAEHAAEFERVPSLRAGGRPVKALAMKATGRELFFSEIRKKFKRPPLEAVDPPAAKPPPPTPATQMMLGELIRRKNAKG